MTVSLWHCNDVDVNNVTCSSNESKMAFLVNLLRGRALRRLRPHFLFGLFWKSLRIFSDSSRVFSRFLDFGWRDWEERLLCGAFFAWTKEVYTRWKTTKEFPTSLNSLVSFGIKADNHIQEHCMNNYNSWPVLILLTKTMTKIFRQQTFCPWWKRDNNYPETTGKGKN